jgi:hypothetical protein
VGGSIKMRLKGLDYLELLASADIIFSIYLFMFACVKER